jgi:aquaporin TIP
VPRSPNPTYQKGSEAPSGRLRSLPAVDQDAGRRAVAEFVGAFTLIFIGGGAGIVSHGDIVAVALANGLAIGIMVTNLGHISGGHFNPAITLAFVLARRISASLAGLYWLAQLAGAVAAALLLRAIFLHHDTRAAVPYVAFVSQWRGLLIETVLTFFLVWAVWATAVDPRGAFKSIAGLAIGLTITMDVFVGGPLTGAAMNPARAFGPQLVENFWGAGWVYYVGPPLGAVIAALAYEWLYLRPVRPVPVGPPETGVEEPRPGETATS